MRARVFVTLTAFVIAGLAPQAQTQAPRAPRAHVTAPQQQTPYTAEFKVTTVRTLANGSTITRESTDVLAADTEGRTMMSHTSVTPSGEEHTFTSVNDPVAGTHISWDSNLQQATIIPKGVPQNCAPTRIPKAPSSQQQMSTEDLGIQTIGGVEAHGHRTTITTPVGMIGNSEPLVAIHENWRATAIGPSPLIVREIDDSPENGRTTRELTSLTQSDPPLSTFQPPEGYETVNRDAPTPSCPVVQAAPVTSPVAR